MCLQCEIPRTPFPAGVLTCVARWPSPLGSGLAGSCLTVTSPLRLPHQGSCRGLHCPSLCPRPVLKPAAAFQLFSAAFSPATGSFVPPRQRLKRHSALQHCGALLYLANTASCSGCTLRQRNSVHCANTAAPHPWGEECSKYFDLGLPAGKPAAPGGGWGLPMREEPAEGHGLLPRVPSGVSLSEILEPAAPQSWSSAGAMSLCSHGHPCA